MSTKRKIEDYKDQKVAIHCSTKEEWDKIVDLFPSGRSIKKIYWQANVNNGKSDTINIDGCGWSPKKHYEDNGYTIYPASDFLEEETVNSLIEDEIYSCAYETNHQNYVLKYNKSNYAFFINTNSKTFSKSSWSFWIDKKIKIATPEEKHWFLECEKANKFIPYDEAMETFEKSFKFNIGDEIKAKPGGYYFSYPKGFAESHKKQFPSSESGILGKITERTQAQGFNWYRCGQDRKSVV